jgi:murein DD-endopeptidase MepM/ murein hydrolase activator NlpD
MEFKFRQLVASTLLCMSFATSSAESNDPKTKILKEPATPVATHEAINNFIADRVSFKKEMAIKELSTINTISLAAELNREAVLYPADELYGSWENNYVDPTRGSSITLPDSCEIDCASFVSPTDTFIRITSKFGPRRRRMHKGIDLKVYTGDTIRSVFSGRVRMVAFDRRGYGKYIVIRHPNGLETVYGHLSKHIIKENDYVKAGAPIGLGGNTGRSTGSHLHFETRFLGQAINPSEIIDFENEVQKDDLFVFRNVKINGRKSNIYTSSTNQTAYHRIKSGDTLGAIARRYGTSISNLCRLNGISKTTTLKIGRSLCYSAAVKASKVEVKTKVQAKTIAKKTEAPRVQAKQIGTEAADASTYHKIKSGDTLGGLAVRYKTTVKALCRMNNITPRTILNLGRSIRCS